MPTARDFDQMMRCALTMKAEAQKMIDFAKPYTSDSVPDDAGEEDLKEVDDDEEDDTSYPAQDEEEDSGASKKGKGRVQALAILLKKKMNGKK